MLIIHILNIFYNPNCISLNEQKTFRKKDIDHYSVILPAKMGCIIYSTKY